MLPLWIEIFSSFHEMDVQGFDPAEDRPDSSTLSTLPPPVLPLSPRHASVVC